jgi:hypothetical protein
MLQNEALSLIGTWQEGLAFPHLEYYSESCLHARLCKYAHPPNWVAEAPRSPGGVRISGGGVRISQGVCGYHGPILNVRFKRNKEFRNIDYAGEGGGRVLDSEALSATTWCHQFSMENLAKCYLSRLRPSDRESVR